MVRPKKSTSFVPLCNFATESINHAFSMHLKSARKLVVSSSGYFAAMQMSSTYCTHCSALMTGSKFSNIKFKSAERNLLRLFASLSYAKVRLVK